MEWSPMPKDATKRATPDASSAAVATTEAPSRKVTVPVGVPEKAGATVAIRVVELPAVAAGCGVRVVVVAALLTVSVRVAEAVPRAAAIGCAPMERAAVVRVA